MRPIRGLLLAGGAVALFGCASPPVLQAPPSPTIGLNDAMMQTLDALAAARAHGRQRGVRACGVEAVFQVMAVPVAGREGALLVLAPPDAQDGPHSSTVTLTLGGDDCDAPEAPPARRR